MKDQACLSCPQTDKCREVWAEENRGPLTSGGLVVCSVLAFLMPLAIAIVAGAVGRAMGYSENIVILFSVVGLLIGGSLAALLVYLLRKRFSRVLPLCPEQDYT